MSLSAADPLSKEQQAEAEELLSILTPESPEEHRQRFLKQFQARIREAAGLSPTLASLVLRGLVGQEFRVLVG